MQRCFSGLVCLVAVLGFIHLLPHLAHAGFDDAVKAFRGQGNQKADFARGERLLRSCAWQDADLYCQEALGHLYLHGNDPSGGNRPGSPTSGAREEDEVEAYVWYFLASWNDAVNTKRSQIHIQARQVRDRALNECRNLGPKLGIPPEPLSPQELANLSVSKRMLRNQVRKRIEYILMSRGAPGYMMLGELYMGDVELRDVQPVAGHAATGGAGREDLLNKVRYVRDTIREELIELIGDATVLKQFLERLIQIGESKHPNHPLARLRDVYPFVSAVDPDTNRPGDILTIYNKVRNNPEDLELFLEDVAAAASRRLRSQDEDRLISLLQSLLNSFPMVHPQGAPPAAAVREARRRIATGSLDTGDAIVLLDDFLYKVEKGHRNFFGTLIAKNELVEARDALDRLAGLIGENHPPRKHRDDDYFSRLLLTDVAELAAKVIHIHHRLVMLADILDEIIEELEKPSGAIGPPYSCASPFPTGVERAFQYFNKAERDLYPASNRIVYNLRTYKGPNGQGISGRALQDLPLFDWLYPPRAIGVWHQPDIGKIDQAVETAEQDLMASLAAGLRYPDASIRLPEHEQELSRVRVYFPSDVDRIIRYALHAIKCGDNFDVSVSALAKSKRRRTDCIKRYQRALGAPTDGQLAPWEVVHLLKLAARKDRPSADAAYRKVFLLWLGKMYFNAVGVPLDEVMATRLFKKTLGQGDEWIAGILPSDPVCKDGTPKCERSQAELAAMCYLHRIYSTATVVPRDERALNDLVSAIPKRVPGKRTPEAACAEYFK